jgi:hypothetical protein
MTDTETAYLLARARDEAVAAIQAQNPAVSAVHQRLSLLYSARAAIELGHDEEEAPAMDRTAPIAMAWR